MSAKKVKQDAAEQAPAEDSMVENPAEVELLEAEASTNASDETRDEASFAEQLEAAQNKAAENWELVLRARADMENLRRRTQKDLENAHKYALERFVQELLPIMDSMELGLVNENVEAEALREGMQLTLSMLQNAFGKFKIEAIDPLEQKFDPELHQAMAMQPSAEVEPNIVLAVMQKGYTLNERLVRPAMVMVSRASE